MAPLTSVRRPGVPLVVVLSTLATVTALLQSMVVPVLGKMSHDLGVSTPAIGWVVTINLLAAAVLTPVLSKIGDLHGRRRVLLSIVALVAAGSLLAACTSSFAALLVARIAQGAAFCIFPLSVGIARDHLAAHRLPVAMSFLTGAISVGVGAGLVMTGILTHGDRDYRHIFWFTLTVSLVLLAAAIVIIPKDRPTDRGRVDWLGALGLAVALVLLLLTLTQGNTWGWASAPTLGCLVGSIVVFWLWLFTEKRVREPLVPIPMLRHRTLASTNIVGFFIGFGMFLIFLSITALVQVPTTHRHGFSASVIETSLIYLLPAAMIGIVASPLGGVSVSRFGGRVTLLAGSALGLLGYAQLAIWHSSPWQIILGAVVANAAFSIGFAAVPAIVVSVVRPQDTALANAVASISRSAGSAVGSALVVALIAGHLMSDGHPDEATFVIAFVIGTITMALSILAVLIGIPGQQYGAASPDIPLTPGDQP